MYGDDAQGKYGRKGKSQEQHDTIQRVCGLARQQQHIEQVEHGNQGRHLQVVVYQVNEHDSGFVGWLVFR